LHIQPFQAAPLLLLLLLLLPQTAARFSPFKKLGRKRGPMARARQPFKESVVQKYNFD
jgi:hypothetical protein